MITIERKNHQRIERDDKKQLTIRDMIEILSSLPEELKDTTVMTEGCDCVGEAMAISVYKDGIEVSR